MSTTLDLLEGNTMTSANSAINLELLDLVQARNHSIAQSTSRSAYQREAANDVRYGLSGVIDYDPVEVMRVYQRRAAYIF
jgi:hypothetical protein